jgi:hypothetical protein
MFMMEFDIVGEFGAEARLPASMQLNRIPVSSRQITILMPKRPHATPSAVKNSFKRYTSMERISLNKIPPLIYQWTCVYL